MARHKKPKQQSALQAFPSTHEIMENPEDRNWSLCEAADPYPVHFEGVGLAERYELSQVSSTHVPTSPEEVEEISYETEVLEDPTTTG